jgi:hypothetical protein
MNQIISENVESKTILINNQLLEVFEDGRVFRINKKGDLLIIQNTSSNKLGYNQIWCKGKIFFRHRIIGFAFLNLDISNPKQQIDHRDGNKINNCVQNLRIVSNQQNQWNQLKAKGFCWNKRYQKYMAYIKLNGKLIYLGYFLTEEEARAAYLAAKQVYHVIN